MHRGKIGLALALTCLALVRQEEVKPEPGLRLLPEGTSVELQRVYVADAHGAPGDLRDSWSRRLLQSDLELREAAFDELVGRARSDDHLRLMLQEFAVDPAHQDRAWTARLALRELNRDRVARALPTLPGQGLQPGLARLMALQMELEDALLRVDDPHFGGWFQHFNEDLKAILGPSEQDGCAEESKCFNLEIAPDGVRCKLYECIDGQEVKTEYKADSYEELLKANPELRVHVKGSAPQVKGLDFTSGGALPSGTVPAAAVPSSPNRVDQLGIKTSAPGATRAEKFGLDEGQGLLVMRLLPGSLASVLGIRRGDVVTEIDSIKIFSGADVRQMLSQRDAKAELRVVVINSRGQRKDLIWKPNL